MKKLRQNKGITLIALIITIIVMLILVGVTINVALNGGLFTKASEASEQMQRKAEEEELLSAVVASIGTDGKVGNIVLPAGWYKLTDGKYRSPKDNMYRVYDNGKIEYIGKYTGGGSEPVAFTWESVGLENIDTNTEYVSSDGLSLNFSTDGKITAFSSGMVVLTIDGTKYTETGKIDFTEGVEAVLGEEGRIKVEMNTNKTDIDLTIIYFEEDGTEGDSEVYTCEKILLENEDIYSNEEVLQALGATGGTYKGTWTVIERDASGNPTKLVSTSAVAYCELGEDNNLEKSISDYKNAVSILNTAAQTATGIGSARSVEIEDIYSKLGGEGNVNRGEFYGRIYNYYYNADEQKVYSKYKQEDGNWSDPYNTGYSSQTFVDDNGNTVVVDSAGDEVTLTYTYYWYDLTDEQKEQIGTLASGYYWLASPCVYCDSSNAHFDVRCMRGGNVNYYYLFSSNGSASNCGYGVRAVVSVSGL